MDHLSPATRRRVMASIHGKDTKPELFIRKALHSLGFRFRCHYKPLPGKPDIVLPMYKAVILVNGCFWHGHDCHIFKMPKSRTSFWEQKISRNQNRDQDNKTMIAHLGWRVLIVWECAIQGREKLSPDYLIGYIARWILTGEQATEVRGNPLKADHHDSQHFGSGVENLNSYR